MAHTPEDFTLAIGDTAEKALQRAIWQCVTSRVGATTVTWLDIELPVDVGGRDDSQRIDLVGVDDGGAIVLCELKFGTPGHGSPIDAGIQVHDYRDAIVKNADGLGHHKKSEQRGVIDWQQVASESTRLIVAANKAYWDYWRERLDVVVPDGIECYELPIDSSCFKDQKPEKSTYTPKITDAQNTWTRVLSLRVV